MAEYNCNKVAYVRIPGPSIVLHRKLVEIIKLVNRYLSCTNILVFESKHLTNV